MYLVVIERLILPLTEQAMSLASNYRALRVRVLEVVRQQVRPFVEVASTFDFVEKRLIEVEGVGPYYDACNHNLEVWWKQANGFQEMTAPENQEDVRRGLLTFPGSNEDTVRDTLGALRLFATAQDRLGTEAQAFHDLRDDIESNGVYLQRRHDSDLVPGDEV